MSEASALERILAGLPEDSGKLLIVDGVYSMGGDIAPLPEMVPICKKYGARIMVDDAHAVGVIGGGAGTAAHFGLTDQVDLIMGTFSKSFASLGGFIAGDEDPIHYIQHHARSLIFSASMPASNVAAVLAALDIMEREPERVDRLWVVTERMRAGLVALGFNMGPSVTPIIPIITGFPGYFIASFFTGSLLIETIFSLDGMGLLAYQSVLNRDYPVVLGTLYFFTLIGLVARLLSDLSYVLVDPRISFSRVDSGADRRRHQRKVGPAESGPQAMAPIPPQPAGVLQPDPVFDPLRLEPVCRNPQQRCPVSGAVQG